MLVLYLICDRKELLETAFRHDIWDMVLLHVNVNNKGTYQPAHTPSLISDLVYRAVQKNAVLHVHVTRLCYVESAQVAILYTFSR